MQYLRSICLGLAACAFLGGTASSQNVMSLEYPAESLSQLKETQVPMVAVDVDNISQNWKIIADSFDKVGTPTPNFQRAMDHNKQLLLTAAAKPNDPVSAVLLSDVKEDLAIKVKYIGQVTTVNALSYSEVEVEVKTMRNGQEVDGYFIGFNPKALPSDDPMFRFNNPTSPSSGKLPAGRYEMIALRNDQIVQRQEVSVGTILGQGQLITFMVP